MKRTAILVLAAGQGTRMQSDLPKVLHPLAGEPLLAHVLATAFALEPARVVVIVGHQAERVRQAFSDHPVVWALQQPLLGTGHAVQCALPMLEGSADELLIINGDVPLLRSATLQALLADHRAQQRAVTVLTTRVTPATGYGRIVRNGQGVVERIVEEKDADAAIRAIDEINTGAYCFSMAQLPQLLAGLTTNNAQKEYYLTDCLTIARDAGLAIGALLEPDSDSLGGVNTRRHLAELEALFQKQQTSYWMEQGVTVVDPNSCWIGRGAKIGRDTVLEPQVVIGAGVQIEAGCHIGPFCQIRASRLGQGTKVDGFCHLDGVEAGEATTIGPYARLRPGTVLETKAKVGNFCEIKKAHIGQGSKVSHLAYIGDTVMGRGVNVGAGTITCNYDGVNKHQTIIEDDVFIGSDTQLVAPVRIGAGAVLGAGSTITREVPPGALAVTRVNQHHILNWPKKTKL